MFLILAFTQVQLPLPAPYSVKIKFIIQPNLEVKPGIAEENNVTYLTLPEQ
jgi:hypothetical protein